MTKFATAASGDVVVARTTVDLVAMQTTVNEVVAEVSGLRVATWATAHDVVTRLLCSGRIGGRHVHALVAVHDVVTLVSTEAIVGTATEHLVRSGSSDQQVVAGTARELVGRVRRSTGVVRPSVESHTESDSALSRKWSPYNSSLPEPPSIASILITDEEVVAVGASRRVACSWSALDQVDACPTVGLVVARTTLELVALGATVEDVVALVAVDRVNSRVAIKGVVTLAAFDAVVTFATGERVVCISADEDVVTRAALEIELRGERDRVRHGWYRVAVHRVVRHLLLVAPRQHLQLVVLGVTVADDLDDRDAMELTLRSVRLVDTEPTH